MVKLFQKRKSNSTIAVFMIIAASFWGCENNTTTNYTAFKCVETPESGSPRSYPVYFYKTKNNSTDYLISNFHNFSESGEYDIRASVSDNKITISPSQSLGNLRIKSGSGTVNQSFTIITIDYIVFNGVNDIPVHVVYSR